MIIEPVNPPELAKPSGFSHAVVATGGRIVFLAGQTALDAGGAVVGHDVVAQFEQALGNLLSALRAALATAPRARRSAPSGAAWPGRSTRQWLLSRCRGCGTPTRWWRSRVSQSSSESGSH